MFNVLLYGECPYCAVARPEGEPPVNDSLVVCSYITGVLVDTYSALNLCFVGGDLPRFLYYRAIMHPLTNIFL